MPHYWRQISLHCANFATTLWLYVSVLVHVASASPLTQNTGTTVPAEYASFMLTYYVSTIVGIRCVD